MTSLDEILAELGLSQYLEDFLDQGFDTWQTILDITEADFDALGIKLGHRRKIQRKIADSRGISSYRALEDRSIPPHLSRIQEDTQKTKPESKEIGGVPGIKRKYRRHPKPDENAPERPPSAYVIFSNKMREELKGKNLSFTEIAKLVGERWQNLSSTEKEHLEQQAFIAKERYNCELLDYKKTNNYKKYSSYLADFKARHSCHSSGEVENPKRPRLDTMFTLDSSSNGSSTESSVTSKYTDPLSNYSRSDSVYSVSTPSSTTCSWPRVQNIEDSPARESSNPTTMPLVQSKRSNPVSPSLISPTTYLSCPIAHLNNSHERSDSLLWRDSQRDDKPTPHQNFNEAENKGNQAQKSPINQNSDFCQMANQIHQLKFEKHDNVNKTSPTMNTRNASPTFMAPQTLEEPSIDRSQQLSLQFDSKFGHKSMRQLPPLISPHYSSFSQAQGKHNMYQHQYHPSLNYLKDKIINSSMHNLSPQDFSKDRLGCVRNLVAPGAPKDIFLNSSNSLLTTKNSFNHRRI